MSIYIASSSDTFSGAMEVLVETADSATMEDRADVQRIVQSFVDGVNFGCFYPGRSVARGPRLRGRDASNTISEVTVVDLPRESVHVLGGLLQDAQRRGVALRSAVARLNGSTIDLLAETRLRPAAARGLFQVELGNNIGSGPRLVEIEFADDVPHEEQVKMLAELATWEDLTVAYPRDSAESVEVSQAQRHFNDQRTIHYYDWFCDYDIAALNLVINLGCMWNQRRQLIRMVSE